MMSRLIPQHAFAVQSLLTAATSKLGSMTIGRLYLKWMLFVHACQVARSFLLSVVTLSLPAHPAPRHLSSVASPSLFQQTTKFIVLNAYWIPFLSLIQLQMIVLHFDAPLSEYTPR